MRDWKNLAYLSKGNDRQQQAYSVVKKLALWPVLRDFDPILVGTIPLAIDLPDSDLDIICEVPLAKQAYFEKRLRANYGHLPGFQLRHTGNKEYESLVSSFRYAGMVIEVFGQALPTSQQYAFRHLVVEHAILQAGGDAWREAVHSLKKQGLKTEPAFALLLHLPGNPYDALLALEGKSPSVLSVQLAQCTLPPLAS